MTSRELVKAAIAHRETPRTPYFIRVCRDAWEQLEPIAGGKSQDEFFRNDCLAFPNPWWGWALEEADWRRPELPVTRMRHRGRGDFGAFYDRLKESKDREDRYNIVLIYGSHIEKAQFARGFEHFMTDMAAEPAFAQRVLDRIIEMNCAFLECILSCEELDGVLLGSDWGTQLDLLCSPNAWDEMIGPGEKRQYDMVHEAGKDAWVHSCGKIDKIIPRLVEFGLDVLNPVQPECMDLATLKRDFGDDLTFWGGITTQTVLPFGTPDEVREEARRVRRLLGAGGGYIFAPSQDLQNDVPPENVIALLETAREANG